MTAHPDIVSGRVSVVVVTYRCAGIVGRTLDSLREQAWPDVEVVVVDNASDDGTVALVRDRLPEADVHELARNLGFAEANNVGVAASSGEFVFMLNPDAWVEPDTIGRLVDALGDPGVGVVGGTVRHEDGSVQERGNLLDRTGFPLPRRGDVAPLERDTFYVGGCALMLRRSDWDRAGGLDGRLFMFCEEVDLCWRIQLLDRDVAVVRDAVVWHVGGATLAGGYASGGRHRTSARRIYLRERNTLAMVLANAPVRALGWVALGWLGNVAEAMVFLVRGEWRISLQYPRALAWNVAHLPSTLARRRRVAASRVRPHRAVREWARGSAKLALLRSTGGLPTTRGRG